VDFTSTAAVFHNARQPLTLESFPIPQLAPGEALVRIRCATICGSDLHTIAGRRSGPTPCILGHEMVGDLVAANNLPLPIGTRVTWSMVWSCRDCALCRLGLPSQCERRFKFGHHALGQGQDLSGAYAQHCHLPAGTAIFPVPANVPDEVAAPANCATATVAAVLRHAGDLHGQSVIVMGAGTLGLTACAMARDAGAAQVVALDPDPIRLARTADFGASIAEPTPADLALDFAGTPEAAEQALGLLRPGGHLILAGAVFPSRPMSLSGEHMVRRMLRITGVYNYRPEDLGRALEFLAATSYPFASLIGGRFPLTAINSAIAYAEKERPPRVAIYPL